MTFFQVTSLNFIFASWYSFVLQCLWWTPNKPTHQSATLGTASSHWSPYTKLYWGALAVLKQKVSFQVQLVTTTQAHSSVTLAGKLSHRSAFHLQTQHVPAAVFPERLRNSQTANRSVKNQSNKTLCSFSKETLWKPDWESQCQKEVGWRGRQLGMIGVAFQCSIFLLHCFHRPCISNWWLDKLVLPSDLCSSALIHTPVSSL